MISINNPLNAPMIYAAARGSKCEGHLRCHWCGAGNNGLWPHDDITIIPFGPRSKQAPMYPGSHSICTGCWMFRQKRLTITYLTKASDAAYHSWKDGQAPMNHSWWITDSGCWTVRKEDHPTLLGILLNPPRRFVLSLLEKAGIVNLIHRAIGNDVAELRKDTALGFTIDNVPLTYTVYELEQAAKIGTNGMSAGTRALCNMIGVPSILDPGPEPKRTGPKGGRPLEPKEDGRVTKKVLALSGQTAKG